MKKTLLFAALIAATLFTAVSCASKQAAEDNVDAPSQARTEALAKEGAIDLAEFQSPDKFAIKYDAEAYTLTCKGPEYFYFDLPQELIPNETVITVNMKGTNNGVEGFRVWVDTGSQRDLSDPVYMGAVGEGLPAGDFDITFELNANKDVGGTCLWIKGPRWGTMIDNVTFKSITVIYN